MVGVVELTSHHLRLLDAVDQGQLCFYNGLASSFVGDAWQQLAPTPVSSRAARLLHDLWGGGLDRDRLSGTGRRTGRNRES